jgi:hypothetical protein
MNEKFKEGRDWIEACKLFLSFCLPPCRPTFLLSCLAMWMKAVNHFLPFFNMLIPNFLFCCFSSLLKVLFSFLFLYFQPFSSISFILFFSLCLPPFPVPISCACPFLSDGMQESWKNGTTKLSRV